jgi:hypothetical protein
VQRDAGSRVDRTRTSPALELVRSNSTGSDLILGSNPCNARAMRTIVDSTYQTDKAVEAAA